MWRSLWCQCTYRWLVFPQVLWTMSITNVFSQKNFLNSHEPNLPKCIDITTFFMRQVVYSKEYIVGYDLFKNERLMILILLSLLVFISGEGACSLLTLWSLGLQVSLPLTLSDPVIRTSISIGFVASVNSIITTFHLLTIYIAHYRCHIFLRFCLIIQYFDPSHDYIFSILSVTSSEYQYLHLHWTSAPCFLLKIVHRVQNCHSKLHVMPKLNRHELSTVT